MMDGWKIQELRAAVLSDLHDFIPRGYYSNVRKDEDMVVNDFALAIRLQDEQNKAPKFTPRQLAAVWLLEKIGMYCHKYESPDPKADAAEGITPEGIKETALEYLQNALGRYAAYLGAEEAKALMPADALAAKQVAPDERIPVGKQQQQDDAILKWLELNKYDPLKIPMPPNGKAGVRKDCRDALTKESKYLFSTEKVFNTAWQRLRTSGGIDNEKIASTLP